MVADSAANSFPTWTNCRYQCYIYEFACSSYIYIYKSCWDVNFIWTYVDEESEMTAAKIIIALLPIRLIVVHLRALNYFLLSCNCYCLKRCQSLLHGRRSILLKLRNIWIRLLAYPAENGTERTYFWTILCQSVSNPTMGAPMYLHKYTLCTR